MIDYAEIACSALRDWAIRQVTERRLALSERERQAMLRSYGASREFLRRLESIPEKQRAALRTSREFNSRAFAAATTFHLPPLGVSGLALELLERAGRDFDYAFARGEHGMPVAADRHSSRLRGVRLTHAAIHLLCGTLGVDPDEPGRARPEWPADRIRTSVEPPGMPPARRDAMIGELEDIGVRADRAEAMLRSALASPSRQARTLRTAARGESATVRERTRNLSEKMKPYRERLLATDCVAALLRIPSGVPVREDGRMNLNSQYAGAVVVGASVSAAMAIVMAIDNAAVLAAAARD